MPLFGDFDDAANALRVVIGDQLVRDRFAARDVGGQGLSHLEANHLTRYRDVGEDESRVATIPQA